MQLNRTTKKQSDGTSKTYVYAWRGGPRLFSSEGTEDFRREYEAAVLSRKNALSAMSYRRGRHGYTARRMDLEEFVRRRIIPNCRTRAVAKHIECTITVDAVLKMLSTQGGRCAVTDIPFDLLWRYGKNVHTNPFAPSLDRIDNAKGYTPENIRLVLFAVNAALNEWGEDVLRQIASAICKANLETKKAGHP